jgi:hypothetical protein
MHLVAAAYTPDQREHINVWLSTLPYILPCKFCRASLISYYEELPADYTSSKTLSKWLWRVHGKVNDKLRGQGQQIPRDPPFAAVYNKYKKELTTSQLCDVDDEKVDNIWDFLFSILFQHPRTTKSSPMPDAPSHYEPCNLSDPDKCRWNILEPTEKMPYFRRFWYSLGNILPGPFGVAWRSALYNNPVRVESKGQGLRWLYTQYRKICRNPIPFPAIIARLETHSSDCNKSKRARTCRRRPGSARSATTRRTLKNRH